jgi:hypothetical protein
MNEPLRTCPEGWKVGWKVMRIQHRKIWNAYRMTGVHRFYTKKINTPKKGYGPFCVFKTYSDALSLRGYLSTTEMGEFKIFQVWYLPSRARRVWGPVCSTLKIYLLQGKDLARAFWIVK